MGLENILFKKLMIELKLIHLIFSYKFFLVSSSFSQKIPEAVEPNNNPYKNDLNKFFPFLFFSNKSDSLSSDTVIEILESFSTSLLIL